MLVQYNLLLTQRCTATFTTLATAFMPEARTTSLLIIAMATLLTRLLGSGYSRV